MTRIKSQSDFKHLRDKLIQTGRQLHAGLEISGKSKKLLFFFMVILSASTGCYEDRNYSNQSIILNEWEVNVGNIHEKVRAVPWEFSKSDGGIGAESYNGYGEYRTEFIIPVELRGTQLAFYAQSIDDSDVTYFNNRFIGKTGIFPDEKTGGIETFRSGVREPRIYPIPSDSINYGEMNSITIKVFDYAGNGGIGPNYIPVIGTYEELSVKAENDSYFIILPRVALLSILSVIAAGIIFYISKIITADLILYSLKKIFGLFNMFIFFNLQKKLLKERDQKGEIIFRIIVLISVVISFMFFIFSEMNLKYYFIKSELFWFKAPAILLYAGFIALTILLHYECFGEVFRFSTNKYLNAINLIFSIFSHPMFLSVFLIYLFAVPPGDTMMKFIFTGILIIVIILSALFMKTTFNLLMTGLEYKHEVYGEIFKREAALRLIFIGSIIAGCLTFRYSHTIIQMQSSIIMTVTLIVYAFFSAIFFMKYPVDPPYVPKKKNDLMISRTSVEKIEKVINLINKNYNNDISREYLATAVEMNPDHLSRIFNKVTGKRIDSYINEVRIAKARIDLINTRNPIIKIAMDAGFENLRTFNRLFKEVEGMTPKEFRAVAWKN